MDKEIIEKQETRRASLKALAAAPFIFTIPNGAAIAASSTSCTSQPSSLLEIQNVKKVGENQEMLQGTIDGVEHTFVRTFGDYYSSLSSGESYIYVQDSLQTNQQAGSLVSMSCWTSLHPSSQQSFF